IDHLVVSLHRVPAKSPVAENRMPSAVLLATTGAADVEAGAHELVANAGGFSLQRVAPDDLEWNDVVAWGAERERALRVAGRRLTVSATRLAEDLAEQLAWYDPGAATDEGLRKDAVDLELPPWQRGRYGTAVGRAVHGTLQFCDLEHGHDIDALADAQCAAEGIIGLEASVAALARSALSAPAVRAAMSAEHHRELFVAAPIGDRVLEGYVDLLVRTDDGYVIVDYKTDAWRQGSDRAERIARYRRQLAAYAVALEHVIGEPIVGGVLVHCRTSGDAEQIELDDWAEAIADLRQALQPV
ncbi:MAG TPA: PD-(D/E)XK nuclease family protein, partial [Ilumatobacter sp.]|nr:PD-(D/E)XK nuclease family protein [Ilumatobacter sp.]